MKINIKYTVRVYDQVKTLSFGGSLGYRESLSDYMKKMTPRAGIEWLNLTDPISGKGTTVPTKNILLVEFTTVSDE